MTYQQMFEKARKRVPGLGEIEFLSAINEAQRKFCDRTHILEGQWQFETKDGVMFYPLDKQCIAVEQADHAGQLMDEFGGNTRNIELQA